MDKNKISVTAVLVTGAMNDILNDATPHEAIENYLCPGMRPPVESITIKAHTDEGKIVLLTITQESIHVKVRQ